MNRKQNYVINPGDRFGMLVVIAESPNSEYKKWECRCDCGKRTVVHQTSLVHNATKSCGCLRSSQSSERMKKMVTKHGNAKKNLYKRWKAMIRRCENSSDRSYPLYGGRGITVCDEWHEYEKFESWSLRNGYHPSLTLDRINGGLGYSPNNCRWVDRETQNNNTSRNHFITHDGKTMTIAQWCDEKHLPYTTLKTRIQRGWDIKSALETPKLSK